MSSSLFRRVARHVAVPIGLIASFTLGGSVIATSMPAAPKPAAPLQAPMPVASQQAGPLLAPAPTYISGARILTLGVADAQPYSLSFGATLVTYPGSLAYAYSSSDGIIVPMDLPAGSVILQIDVYGYRTVAGDQTWWFTDWDPVAATATNVMIVTASGTGVVHAVITPTGSQATHALPNEWALVVQADANARYVGAVVQYTLPTNALTPVTPFRVFDTRFSAFGGKVATGTPRTFNVKDSIDVATGAVVTLDKVPAGTVAVAYNLTVTQTEGAGYIAIVPGTGTTVTASAINWSSSGQTIANGGIVTLGTSADERKITLVCGGTGGAKAHVILDITGFFGSEAG